MNATKSPLLSKTLWINFLLALLALFAPGAREFIVANPQLVSVCVVVINMLLRLVTKTGIQIADDSAPAGPSAA